MPNANVLLALIGVDIPKELRVRERRPVNLVVSQSALIRPPGASFL
jgi:hypothetical protein